MTPAEVPAELVEKALEAALPLDALDLERGLAEQEYRDALAVVLPLHEAAVLDGVRADLAGKVIWGDHRSGYSGALVRLDGVPDSAGTNGSIPLDVWLLGRAARLRGELGEADPLLALILLGGIVAVLLGTGIAALVTGGAG